MYAEFFGLRELPFNNTPDPRFFYSTPDHEEALASLIYAVKEKKGFVLLTGEIGAGKTLVSRLMLKHFGGDIAFATINHAIRDSADLMESLCAEFELPHEPGAGNARLVRMLHDFLLAKFARNTPVVLVLDEAQNLSVEAFEQLRMIGNLEADDAKLLQIAIVGQPELQAFFHSSPMRQLRQRLFRSFHLPALDRRAVEGYIRHRLTVAGADDPRLFDAACIDAVHKTSRGIPRLINTVCDNAMLSAYSADRKTLDATFVESVIGAMMIPDSTNTTVDPSTAATTPPQPSERHAQLSERLAEQSRQADQDRELLSVACGQAATLLERMEASSKRSASVAERMLNITNRVDGLHEQSVQRESQLTALLQRAKSSATELAPLLDEMVRATQSARDNQASSQALIRELKNQTARSQYVLDRMTDKLHEIRLAEIRTPPHAGRVPAEASSTNIGPQLVREAQLARSEVPIPNEKSIITVSSRPALQLASRMDNLAALVHQAVTACAPGLPA